MFYLEIQKVKGGTQESYYQQGIGGTYYCMKIIMNYTKGCGQLSSNNTFFSASWFSRVKKTEEKNVEGIDYYGPVKTIHKGFFLATLEK